MIWQFFHDSKFNFAIELGTLFEGKSVAYSPRNALLLKKCEYCIKLQRRRKKEKDITARPIEAAKRNARESIDFNEKLRVYRDGKLEFAPLSARAAHMCTWLHYSNDLLHLFESFINKRRLIARDTSQFLWINSTGDNILLPAKI